MDRSFGFAGDFFPELRRLEQSLADAFQASGATNIRALSRATFPAVNIGSTAESVEVLVFAPGVDAKALQITVDKGLLVIAGERSAPAASPGARDAREARESVYAKERFVGAFRRVVNLPEDADPTRVEATLREGVLRVSVAKRESSKPRQIVVN